MKPYLVIATALVLLFGACEFGELNATSHAPVVVPAGQVNSQVRPTFVPLEAHEPTPEPPLPTVTYSH